MESVGPRHVCKYFEPADRFIRVRRCGPKSAGITPDPQLNRERYRTQVVQACVEEFADGDLNEQLVAIRPDHPDGPQALLELLYQICVHVNPELEIHSVGLVPDSGKPQDRDTPAGGTDSASVPEPDPAKTFRRRVAGLEGRLSRRVVGQDAAVASVAAAIRRTAAGLATPGRPLANLMLLGATGTGKTELAKALQEELFGSDTRPLIIDGSEYALPHETARLLGAPPGYVGFEESGLLARELRRNPQTVVLFDEIEKAHGNLHRLLLQILDEGRLTDGHGDPIAFEHSVVILTSNAGAAERRAALSSLGFGTNGAERQGLAEIQRRALEDLFAPEFLGRLDEIVAFRDLDRSDALEIARGALTDLARRVRAGRGRVRFTSAVAAWVADRGFSLDAGARELGRVVRQSIEPPLAEALLRPGRSTSRWLRVSIRSGQPHVGLDDR